MNTSQLTAVPRYLLCATERSFTASVHFVVLAAIALILAGCEREAEQTDPQAHVFAGEVYLEQGQFRAAMIEVQNALQLNPSSEAALVLQAKVFSELGNYRQVYQLLEPIDGSTLDYHHTLVEAYLNSRKYASALLHLRKHKTTLEQDQVYLNILFGRAYTGLDDTEKANEQFVEALRLDVDNVQARLGLVTLLAIRGDFISAELQLLDILETHPNDINALSLMTGIYLAQGRLQRAEETLTLTISVLPTTDMYTTQRAGVIQTLISLLAQQGRSGEALVYQRILSEAFPTAQQGNEKFQEALAKLENGEIEVAEQLLVDLREIAPGHQAGGALLGVIKFLQGEQTEAQQYFTSAVDLETATTPVLKAMALNLFKLNQPTRVVEVLQRLIDRGTNDPQVQAIYGISAISADMNTEGVAALQKSIDLQPDNPRFRLVLAQFYNGESPPKRDKAAKLLQDGHELAPDSTELVVALANQYLLTNDRDSAETLVNQYVEADPESYDRNVVAGNFWLRLDVQNKARDYYVKALKLDAEQNPALYGLGVLELREGRYSAAREIYQRILKLDATQLAAYRGIMQSYIEEGVPEEGVRVLEDYSENTFDAAGSVIVEYHASNDSLDEAVSYIRKLENRSVDTYETRQLKAEVNYRRAILAAQEGDYAAAREAIFEALNAFPLNLRMLVKLTQVEVDAGQLAEAEKVLNQIRDHHPSSARIPELTGDIALKGEQYVTARASYQETWDRNKGDLVALKLLKALEELGLDDEIRVFVPEWRQAIPRSLEALFYEVKLTGNNHDAAIELYQQYLATWPDTPAVLNNVALQYLRAGKPAAGLRYAEKAYDQEPTNVAIIDTLGWLLHHTGDADRGLQLLRQALKKAPDNEQIAEHVRIAEQEA